MYPVSEGMCGKQIGRTDELKSAGLQNFDPKVSKCAKIRNRYNQVLHLAQELPSL